MSDTVTLALIGITVISIALVHLAAWVYVPPALVDHDTTDDTTDDNAH